MANKSPHKEQQFKKGKTGNQKGRPKLPQDVKDIRKYETSEFIRMMNQFLDMSRDEFQHYLTSKTISVREMRIAKMIEQDLKGNVRYCLEMNERMMGKSKQEVNLNTNNTGIDLTALSKDEIKRLSQKYFDE